MTIRHRRREDDHFLAQVFYFLLRSLALKFKIFMITCLTKHPPIGQILHLVSKQSLGTHPGRPQSQNRSLARSLPRRRMPRPHTFLILFFLCVFTEKKEEVSLPRRKVVFLGFPPSLVVRHRAASCFPHVHQNEVHSLRGDAPHSRGRYVTSIFLDTPFCAEGPISFCAVGTITIFFLQVDRWTDDFIQSRFRSRLALSPSRDPEVRFPDGQNHPEMLSKLRIEVDIEVKIEIERNRRP